MDNWALREYCVNVYTRVDYKKNLNFNYTSKCWSRFCSLLSYIFNNLEQQSVLLVEWLERRAWLSWGLFSNHYVTRITQSKTQKRCFYVHPHPKCGLLSEFFKLWSRQPVACIDSYPAYSGLTQGFGGLHKSHTTT